VSAYVLGAGCSTGCSAAELLELVRDVLALAGIDRHQVGELATIDARASTPALLDVGQRMHWPLATFSPRELASVEVPTPSTLVAARVGTPSVAEAAALLSVRGGRLIVAKQRSANATCALALRAP